MGSISKAHPANSCSASGRSAKEPCQLQSPTKGAMAECLLSGRHIPWGGQLSPQVRSPQLAVARTFRQGPPMGEACEIECTQGMWPALELSPFAGVHWSALLDGVDTVVTPPGAHPGRRRPGLGPAPPGLAPAGVLPFEAPAPLASYISSAGAALPHLGCTPAFGYELEAPRAPGQADLRRSAGSLPAPQRPAVTPPALRGVPVTLPAAAVGSGGPDLDLLEMFFQMRDDLKPECDTAAVVCVPRVEERPPACGALSASGPTSDLSMADHTPMPSGGWGANSSCQWPAAVLQATALQAVLPAGPPQALLPALAIAGSRSCPSLGAQPGGVPRSGAPLSSLADTPRLGRVPGMGSAPSLHAAWMPMCGTEATAQASPESSGANFCGGLGQQQQPGRRLLFRKILTNSDAKACGRIIVPRAVAERDLPAIPSSHGSTLCFHDPEGRQYSVLFKYWMNGASRPGAKARGGSNAERRMYIFQGLRGFMATHSAKAGSLVSVYLEPEGRYVMTCETDGPGNPAQPA